MAASLPSEPATHAPAPQAPRSEDIPQCHPARDQPDSRTPSPQTGVHATWTTKRVSLSGPTTTATVHTLEA